ncbi:MAG TPA: hypothetical protein VJS38_18370 [Phenylobacterium sp.]|uniref:linalool dehydratase/isomerase domain-containing protein n=1 Tax=Phenylobacterium sp. TaxID=1871053 RepID=UPI002B487BFE|nr:hypothetical protein [Phenylobacterium sp.]HKR90139.1 hypothetical protein [Phenylobacterium sp.]
MSVAADVGSSAFPNIGTAALPRLDDRQVGAINHIRNLSRLPPNDWSHMMGRAPMQEDYSAYRYQLAYMYYASALAYKHRLPAAPGLFKDTSNRLIEKMLLPEVWLYWRNASQGKGPFTLDLPALGVETNPVIRDNIMYSGYLQTMALMHHLLFDDARYAQPGSLTFEFRPFLSILDQSADYTYDEKSLNERIYWNMVENGYLGVACEPGCVFQICNQIPILGFRLHDVLYGGEIAREVTEGYLAAWSDFGGVIGPDGHYTTLVVTSNRTPIPGSYSGPWSDAWCGMLMNMWNGEAVKANYERLRDAWIVDGPSGTKSVRLPPAPEGAGALPEGSTADLGWMSAWASEMGDRETLDGLLAHADRFMKPRWLDGGYYYPRCDTSRDSFGNLTIMDPTTGNALLNYARLNVPNGLRKLYENPRGALALKEPVITGISNDAALRCAMFLPDSNALVFTPTAGCEEADTSIFRIENIADRGAWSLSIDGQTVATGDERTCQATGPVPVRVENGAISIEAPLSSEPNIVVAWRQQH